MMKSRFEELMKTQKSPITCRGPIGNPVAEAAKVLEINYAMRRVDQQLEDCKLAIVESLRSYETAAVTLARLEVEREKIATSRGKLREFADAARPQMKKVQEARDAFLALLNDNGDDRQSHDEYAAQLSDAIRQLNDERASVLADLETVGQRVKSLEEEFNDLTTCIKLQKAENAALHATLKQKRKDVISRNRKSLARYDELLKSKDRQERRGAGGIKVEKDADL